MEIKAITHFDSPYISYISIFRQKIIMVRASRENGH